MPKNYKLLGLVGVPVDRFLVRRQLFSQGTRLEAGAGGEIQLTDAMSTLLETQPFHAVTFAGRRYDCGSQAGYIEANLALALDRPDIGAHVRAFATELLGRA